MAILWYGLIAVAMFCLALAADWLEARYVQAVQGKRATRAALMSIGMWSVGTLGLVAVIEVGWWVLPFEALGLFVGTHLGMRSP